MSLPKSDLPRFQITLPISKKSIFFRAYTVREERILLLAKESDDPNQIPVAINQVISNCTGIKDVDKISEIDKEYILLQFKIKIDGPNIVQHYTCKNHVSSESNECKTPLEVTINLDDIKINNRPSILMLNDKTGMSFNDITSYHANTIRSRQFELDIDKIIYSSYILLKNIFKQDDVTLIEDMTFEEYEEWVLDLPSKEYSKLELYIKNEPSIMYETSVKCHGCGKVHNIKLKGLNDFFQ